MDNQTGFTAGKKIERISIHGRQLLEMSRDLKGFEIIGMRDEFGRAVNSRELDGQRQTACNHFIFEEMWA